MSTKALRRPPTPVLVAVAAIVLVCVIYRPLPEGVADRAKMTVVETALRLLYFYPSRVLHFVFSSPHPMLYWTRFILSLLAYIIGPKTMYDPDLMITDRLFDGVPVRVYVPKAERANDGAVVFIHGGGFVIGEINMYDALTRHLARELKMVTLSVDYRLAPEHPFPAGIEDCERVLVDFLNYSHQLFGVDPRKVVVMGDSAGGNLVAVVTQRLRHRTDLPPLKLQALIYPLLQLHDLRTPSYQFYYDTYSHTTFLDPESVVFYYMMYVGLDLGANPHYAYMAMNNEHIPAVYRESLPHFDYVDTEKLLPSDFINASSYQPNKLAVDKKANSTALATADSRSHEVYEALAPYLYDPNFSPLMQTDLTNLPDTYVITCQFDILRDDGAMYVRRLRQMGIDVTWRHLDNGFHAMFNFLEVELSKVALAEMVSWIHRKIDL